MADVNPEYFKAYAKNDIPYTSSSDPNNWLPVINAAMLKVGLPLAQNITDADFNAKYRVEMVLKQVFRAFPWGFATKHTKLDNALSNHGALGWTYSYNLPSNYIRIIDVFGDADIHSPKVPFCIFDGLIACNVNPAYCRHVMYIPDSTRWPVDFFDAVAALLASEIAPLSAQTQAMTPALLQQYQWKLVSAQNVDATETRERVPMDEDIYMARTGQPTQY